MTAITLAQPPDETYDSWDTDVLLEALANGLARTAREMLQMALMVQELERRDVDMAGLRLGLRNHLRKIACGQLLPEVAVQFAGSDQLITSIGNLPLNDQRQLVDGGKVRLLVIGADGMTTHQMADPYRMLPEQRRQVFARDHIRDDAEQALYLSREREKAARPLSTTVGNLKVDDARGGAMCGRTFIPLADLEQAVALLKRRRKRE